MLPYMVQADGLHNTNKAHKQKASKIAKQADLGVCDNGNPERL